jgi:hypothetical protein
MRLASRRHRGSSVVRACCGIAVMRARGVLITGGGAARRIETNPCGGDRTWQRGCGGGKLITWQADFAVAE